MVKRTTAWGPFERRTRNRGGTYEPAQRQAVTLGGGAAVACMSVSHHARTSGTSVAILVNVPELQLQ